MKALLLALAFLAMATPARAQAADDRWDAWVGCWRLWADNLRDAAPAASRLADGSGATQPRNDSAPQVCVTKTPDGGARFETSVRGQTAIDQTVVADAVDRPVTDDECRGTQRAHWSRDGLRLFSRADLTCKDDAASRRVSGLSLLAPNGDWLDIQGIEMASRETVRVRRYYRAVSGLKTGRAIAAGSPLTLDDVKEANPNVPARVLEAALAETGAGFDLDGRSLLDLDDAGVADSVIDLMVALSYPERFVVERTARASAAAVPTFVDDPFLLGWAFGYPYWYSDYFYSPYYYAPFRYSRFGYGGYDVFFDGVTVGAVPTTPQPSGTGRAVDGQGYTRVRPRETASGDGGGRSGTQARDGGGSSGASSGSSSGGSTVSSGGFSSGGSSGGDGGRTAQPR
jgi:hypothetical protein